MYKVGVFPGKFLPPHRGHLNAILQASTKCKKLYVVVSYNKGNDDLCIKSGINPISPKLRARWLSTELAEMEHIKVLIMDEDGIPSFPEGWEMWSNRLKNAIKEKIDIIFGGEPQYNVGYTKYYSEVKYELYDCSRLEYPISATKIRSNPYENWDYILGAARTFFTKKVLITGTEGCGKTTLTKMLAKIFSTSWAREEVRYYSTKYFGSNEEVFELEDFFNIAWEQRQIENYAFKTSNKITFCDTDAVITQYYCEMYMGKQNPKIEAFVDKDRYDLVILMLPDVAWVPGDFRFNEDKDSRYKLHNKLKQMYLDRGFKDKIIEVSGNYNERLNKVIELSRGIIT